MKLIEEGKDLTQEQIEDPEIRDLLVNGIWMGPYSHVPRILEDLYKKGYYSAEYINNLLKIENRKIYPKSPEYKKHEEEVKLIVEAIEREDEQYLLDHKSEIIDNIDDINISISKLPEKLRGDIDLMRAKILRGNVHEIYDLASVNNDATEELRENPEFEELINTMEDFFKEESKLLKKEEKKDKTRRLNAHFERVDKKKEEQIHKYGNTKITPEQALNTALRDGGISFDEINNLGEIGDNTHDKTKDE